MRQALAVAAVSLAAVTPATAQERGVADPRDDILVTGRNFVVVDAGAAGKTDLPVIETPQAISIVDSAFIDALNLRTIAEALNYTSGVRSQAFGSDTRIDYYQIRGFAQANFFKDGLVLYNSGPFLSWTTPAEGVERLEVLKGPSSVLYGGGSAGGIVNIVSKRPLASTRIGVEAGVDEYGSAYGSIDVGGAIAPSLSVRASGLVRRGDTQVELAEDGRSYAALAASWTPTADTTLTIRGSYTGDRSNRPTGFVPYAGFVTPLPDGRRIPIDLFGSDPGVDRFDRDQYEVGYTLESRLSPAVRFVSNGRYGRLDLVYAGLFGAFNSPAYVDQGRYYLNRANSRQEGWLDNFTVDNHVDGEFATGPVTHDVLGGVDYSSSETASTVANGPAPRLDVFSPRYNVPIPALGPASTTRQKLDQTGLYLQDILRWNGFVGLLSTRHDWIGITARGANGGVTRGDPERQTFRAGLSYVSSIGIAPYAAYATSFNPVIGIEPATNRYYRPETGRSWEAGLKYQARTIPLLATASVFTIDRDGVLVANPLPGFPTNQSQLGRVRSRGGEFEVQARPAPTLNLTAALTAFKIENKTVVAGTIGKRPTATPAISASAFADYTFPSGSALPGFGFGGGVRHVGESFADQLNTLAVPSATVFDAALHVERGPLRAALNASNLFDKAYVGACPSAGTCYAANLRRVTLSLGYRVGDRK